MAIFVAILNFLLAATRFLFCVRGKRLLAGVWFLIAYFAFTAIILATNGGFSRFQPYSGDTIKISDATIEYLIYYIFAFNIIFLLAELVFWWLFGARGFRHDWRASPGSRVINRMNLIFFVVLIVGALYYGISSLQASYRDYVEFKGSNWGLVFLWAGAPVVTLLSLQKRYLLAAICSIPFFLFAMRLSVRSFLLLSLIPLFIVFLMQLSSLGRAQRAKLTKRILGVAFAAAVLLGSSAAVMYQKGGSLGLPDAGLPIGAAVIFEAARSEGVQTEWSALKLFGLNLINPFMRLFSISKPEIVDNPVVMAQLFDGIPVDSKVYYHYPTTWYSDAFLSFGLSGLFIPVLWALILCVWERVLVTRTLILGLMLPFYTWFIYMLVRGATAISTVPFSYSVYIVFIIALLIGGTSIFRRQFLNN